MPDPTIILLFLGLFNLVVQDSWSDVTSALSAYHICTFCPIVCALVRIWCVLGPMLSILQDNTFVRAPDGTSLADENVA